MKYNDSEPDDDKRPITVVHLGDIKGDDKRLSNDLQYIYGRIAKDSATHGNKGVGSFWGTILKAASWSKKTVAELAKRFSYNARILAEAKARQMDSESKQGEITAQAKAEKTLAEAEAIRAETKRSDKLFERLMQRDIAIEAKLVNGEMQVAGTTKQIAADEKPQLEFSGESSGEASPT